MPGPSEQLVDNFFTKRVEKILSRTDPEFKVRNQNGSENKHVEIPQPFNKRAIQALALHFENILKTYLNTKDEEFDKTLTLPDDIDTPHPIGLTTTNQAIIIDMLAKLQAAMIRETKAKLFPDSSQNIKYFPEKRPNKASYKTLYAYKIIKELKTKFILTSHEALHNLTGLYDQILDAVLQNKDIPDNIFEELADVLTTELLYCGHATRVISESQQKESAKLKETYLATSTSLILSDKDRSVGLDTKSNRNVKTWVGADKDGDPTTNYQNRLEKIFKDPRLLKEIFGELAENKSFREMALEERPFWQIAKALIVTSKDHTAYEARRAYIKKKGVDGLEDIFTHMDGLPSVRSVEDLNNQEKLDTFKTYVGKLFYDKGDSTETATNIRMDMLLDLLSYNKGFVISDFPEDPAAAKQLLLQLTFARKAIEEILHEKGILPESVHGQIFLPLCEEQESIENLKQVINTIYADIYAQIEIINQEPALTPEAEEAKNTKLIALLKPFIVDLGDGKKTFALGTFTGPSDLTKRMGTTSHFRMVQAITHSFIEFRKFKTLLCTTLPVKVQETLGLKELEKLVEYGRGTALRRGAGSVLPVGRTPQGIGIGSSSKILDKIYHQLFQKGDLSDKNLEAILQYIDNYENYINASADAHRHFFESRSLKDAGKIVEWNDTLINHPPHDRIFKKYPQ